MSHGVLRCELTGLVLKRLAARRVSPSLVCFPSSPEVIRTSPVASSSNRVLSPRRGRLSVRICFCPCRRHDIGVIASASATVIDTADPKTPFFGDYSGMITSREKAATKKRQVTVKLGGA